MRLSNAGTNLLKSIEKLRLYPYDDHNGVRVYQWVQGATIGYGHLLSRAEWPWVCNGIVESAALAMFRQDLAPRERLVDSAVSTPLAQHQFDALVIMAYNIGLEGFATSSLVKLLNDPNADTPYISPEHAWKAWNKQDGEFNQGLANRRAAEWTLFTTGEYVTW